MRPPRGRCERSCWLQRRESNPRRYGYQPYAPYQGTLQERPSQRRGSNPRRCGYEPHDLPQGAALVLRMARRQGIEPCCSDLETKLVPDADVREAAGKEVRSERERLPSTSNSKFDGNGVRPARCRVRPSVPGELRVSLRRRGQSSGLVDRGEKRRFGRRAKLREGFDPFQFNSKLNGNEASTARARCVPGGNRTLRCRVERPTAWPLADRDKKERAQRDSNPQPFV